MTCHSGGMSYFCPKIIANKQTTVFTFKQFIINDSHCAMKVGTDGVLLGAWADLTDCQRILDLGCGSGLIALMAAQRNPQALITGVEIDEVAASDALLNVQNSPFASRIAIRCQDATQLAATEGRYDCILSNPPYHQEELLPPSAARAAARHTAGGGLTFSALLRTVCNLLDDSNQNARFSLILPAPALNKFKTLATIHGLHLTRCTQVVTRPGKPCKRVLLEFCLHKSTPANDELILTAPDGGRSAAYSLLCNDFYL